MLDYKVDDFYIDKFFSYTTTIPMDGVICEVDMNRSKYYPNVCSRFDEFYAALQEKATKIAMLALGEDKYFSYFEDNKTVFQIRHKYNGKVYFIGRYDWRRCIGNYCYLYDGRIYDFKTNKVSDYVSNVKADIRGLWKKFEF